MGDNLPPYELARFKYFLKIYITPACSCPPKSYNEKSVALFESEFNLKKLKWFYTGIIEIHKNMSSVQSSPAQYTVVFPDIVRYAPIRDRYGVILGWDYNNIRESYRKNFKSEGHYLRWKRWCESCYNVATHLRGRNYRAWLTENGLPTIVQKEELFNVLRFGHDWCKKNIASKNMRIGYGQEIPIPEIEDDDDFVSHVEYV